MMLHTSAELLLSQAGSKLAILCHAGGTLLRLHTMFLAKSVRQLWSEQQRYELLVLHRLVPGIVLPDTTMSDLGFNVTFVCP